MRKTILIFLLFVTMLSLFGCSEEVALDTKYEELILSLEEVGFSVVAEDVEKDILLGQRKWLTINENDNISVYLYTSADKMEKDSSYISKDGFEYNNGKESVNIDWVSYPHFFKKDNMIILYIGENPEIINALEEILGLQFAGHIE